jgi:hypothetical protein
MTVSKSSISSTSKDRTKETAKRAVSFSDSVKYGYETSKPKPLCITQSDGDLQASDKRRRYKRRGSKCPSMLMRSGMSLKSLSPDATMMMSKSPSLSSPSSSKDTTSAAACSFQRQQRQMPTPQERRLSLMSALKLSLENATIVDGAKKALQIRKMSPQERRMTTYKLLSQV